MDWKIILSCQIIGPKDSAMLFEQRKPVPDVVGRKPQVPGEPDKTSDGNGGHDFENSTNRRSHGAEDGSAIVVMARMDFVHVCKSKKRKK